MTDDTAAIGRQRAEVDPTEDASDEKKMATGELRRLVDPAAEPVKSFGNDMQDANQSSGIMPTVELRQLLDPDEDELIPSLGNDLQPPYVTTITEIPQLIPESDDAVEPADEVQQPVAASNDAGLEIEREAEVDPGCDPYNRL